MSVTGGKKAEFSDSDMNQTDEMEKSPKIFMRTKYRRSLFLLLFLLLPLWMFLGWVVQPRKVFNLFIMDKTVPNTRYQEHRSFFWVLKYDKYVKPDKSYYKVSNDYKGFFPVEPGLSYYADDLNHLKSDEIDSLADNIDLAAYIDGYGVYFSDWYGIEPGEREDVSPMLYGGISKNDILFLQALVKRNKPILAEFSFMGPPTHYRTRFMIDTTFHIKTTGWSGRYFDDLDLLNTDIPRLIFHAYQDQYNSIWDLQGPGTILVNENGRILILQADKDLRTYWPIISTREKWQKKLKVDPEIRYPFWFEIISYRSGYEMISEYYLDVTESGDSLLSLFGIPNAFPATLLRIEPSLFLYYTGDFSDSKTGMLTAYFKGIQYFRSLFFKESEPLDRDKFFWEYYINMTRYYLNMSYLRVSGGIKNGTLQTENSAEQMY